MPNRRVIDAVCALIVCVLGTSVPGAQQPPAASLRIVVIEGEGAVNIIQQKTAVAPVIEVRDRNDQPVAGATVNFVVRAGRATFGGARTLTVTTNAAGRAAAAGFAPSGTGALQIGATATFQGQTAAAVTIAQTNVMTAAQAAAASSAGAGGGGGGVSGTTVGVVGGAAAAAAVVVTQLPADQPAAASPTARFFTADASGTFVVTFASTNPVGVPCTNIDRQTLAITIRLDPTEGAAAGTMTVNGDVTRVPGTCPSNEDNNYTVRNAWTLTGPLSGTRDNMSATVTQTSSFSTPRVSGQVVDEFGFTGRLDGDAVSGVLTYTTRNSYRNVDGVSGGGFGTARYDVRLGPRP